MNEEELLSQELLAEEVINKENNDKLVLKQAKKHFNKLGFMYFWGSIILHAVAFLVSYIATILLPGWPDNTNIYLTLSVVPMYLIGMPLMIMLINTVPKQAPPKHSMRVGQYIQVVFMSIAIMYISNLVGLLITSLIGAVKGSSVVNPVMDITTDLNPILAILYMVICAPMMEEFIFRKLLVDRVRKYGEGLAILFSGLFFGLFHGNLSQFAYAFTLGMFFAFIYVKTGKIWYTVGLHMVINFFGGVVSTYMIQLIDYEGYMNAAIDSEEAMLQYMSGSVLGWMVYMLYVLFLLFAVVTGIILLIVKRKSFKLEAGELTIPRGRVFGTAFFNLGVMAFSIFWIVLLVLQLFE